MSQPTEINDFKPSSLSHLIGQRKVIEQVEVALDASMQDSKRLDHCLMVGPPGLGKSALAQVIAQEMATGFHEVLGQSLILQRLVVYFGFVSCDSIPENHEKNAASDSLLAT